MTDLYLKDGTPVSTWLVQPIPENEGHKYRVVQFNVWGYYATEEEARAAANYANRK